MQQTHNDIKSLNIRVLAPYVQIFTNGDHEYRLRKGIWNFEEAVLNLEEASENIKIVMCSILDHLQNQQVLDLNRLTDFASLPMQDWQEIIQVIDGLTAGEYLAVNESPNVADHMYAQILGNEKLQATMSSSNPDPILFFSDSETVIAYAKGLAKDTDTDIEFLQAEEMNEISNMDLTSRYEAYDLILNEQKLCTRFKSYACIVGCLERPRVSFLRNLNRILLRLSKPSVLSLIDGPFTSVMAIKPPETGCFECYETRLMARLQDRAVYTNYVEKTRSVSMLPLSAGSATLLHGTATLALQEGMLLQKTHRSRLAGRVQSTFIPLLEIQMQDLLRVPICPACGQAASIAEEMYTASTVIADTINSRISLTDNKS